jgi:hypothetical protein
MGKLPEKSMFTMSSHASEHYFTITFSGDFLAFRIGECPSNSPFLKNNGAEAPKGPSPIVFKEWRDTRTFSNLKSTHYSPFFLRNGELLFSLYF